MECLWFNPAAAHYSYCTNEFQKEAVTFVASLSPQVPKCRFFPVNAERPKDVATAKVSSTLQEMIERKNKVKSRQKQVRECPIALL